MRRHNATVVEDKEFVAFYNSRDLILYALSVGFGSTATDEKKQPHEELKYLYEQHPDFTAVPTFCLALSFWANQNQSNAISYAIPPFPPPSMTATVTIPARYIHSNVNADISTYPILHMWQSIQWHCNLPVPTDASTSIQTLMNCKILTIAPKKIGTFVTSETTIVDETSRSLLCTLQSTALVLGIPKEAVIPMDISQGNNTTLKSKPVPVPRKGQPPDFQWTYETSPTQSLLYRLASGDSNRIHVLGDALLSQKLKLGDTQKPILHGLCTFGIATRAILQYAATTDQTGHTTTASSLTHLEGRFSKPVFIGDTLVVKLWDMSSSLKNQGKTTRFRTSVRMVAFRVHNVTTGDIAVSQGYAELRIDDRRAPGSLSKL